MNRLTSWLLKAAAASTLTVAAFAGNAFAQGGPVEGRDFTVIAQQPTQSAGKVEVVEFFQYGCIHCFNLEPVMSDWEKKLPKDVVLRRMPLSFDPGRVQHVRMFYVLEALNRLSDLHMRAFNAIHNDKRFLMTPEDQADYFSKFGVDKTKYMELYNSFTVQTKTRAAQQMFVNYKIEATPAIAVDGRYVSSPTAGGGHAEMLRVVDALIDRVRKEKGIKPAAAPAAAQPAAAKPAPAAKPTAAAGKS
ncbi:MAG: thiol:disulfide interchange protein DsbA/DsbL [Burkholderiaceae bacterium]